MIKNDFTYIDAINQFWVVWENSEKRSLTCIGLYFYLVKQWNAGGRALQFRHRSTVICNELGISKPTLETARFWLKQNFLIDFFSRGKGDPNITYEILEVKKTYFQKEENFTSTQPEEVKKAKNITSDFTSHFTSHLSPIKQSKELIVEVEGEVKNFYYLQEVFEKDEGLRRNWKQKGFDEKEFACGLEKWMILHHGSKYDSLKKAREHFLFWMPNYSKEMAKRQQNGKLVVKNSAVTKENDKW